MLKLKKYIPYKICMTYAKSAKDNGLSITENPQAKCLGISFKIHQIRTIAIPIEQLEKPNSRS